MRSIIFSIGFVYFGTVGPALANTWQIQDNNARQMTLHTQLNIMQSGMKSDERRSKQQIMAASPLAFYRGSAQLYYSDLNQQGIVVASDFYRADAVTWIQGDMHVQNMKLVADPQASLVFGVNHFADAWVANYLYDLYRASTSVILVANEQGFSGILEQQDIVHSFVEAYLDALDSYRNNNDELAQKVIISEVDEVSEAALIQGIQEAQDVKKAQSIQSEQAKQADNARELMLKQWTSRATAQRYFQLNNGKLAPVTQAERLAITAAIANYVPTLNSELHGKQDYFRVLDVARPLNTDIHSLGAEQFYVLIAGESHADSDDRILVVKRQGLPAVYPYLSGALQFNILQAFGLSLQGCRVAAAQRALLTVVDAHLGCTSINRFSYTVRELSPWQQSVDNKPITSIDQINKLAELWGLVLATAHAKADVDYDAAFVGHQFEDVMFELIAHRQNDFRAEVFAFAHSYAEQVVVDHRRFVQMVEQGLLYY